MTEFYQNISEDECQELIQEKMKIYDDKLYCFGGSIVLSHDHFVYRYYADFHKKEIGSFELVRYLNTAEGMDIYSFFVEREITEETKNAHRKRNKMYIESCNRGKIKKKYEKMKAAEIYKCLETKGLSKKGKKDDKIKRLVEYDLEELVNESL